MIFDKLRSKKSKEKQDLERRINIMKNMKKEEIIKNLYKQNYDY